MLQSDAPALHVYWQVVPLQLAVEALFAVHTSPQALQFCVVFSVVHVLPQVTSRHVQDPFEQSGVGWAHGVELAHMPLLLQVWGVLPLH